MFVVMLSIPMTIDLLTVHAIVPPHPVVTAVAIGLNADIARVILYGLIVGFPAAAIARLVVGKMIDNKFKLNAPERFLNLTARPDDQLAAFWTTPFAILFTLILMIAKTILEVLLGKITRRWRTSTSREIRRWRCF
ncbi:MAG: dsdX 1 [Proteobacteria bacterium]|nr:dsdX 1 [Pseudomonadota bacterium]MBS1228670.1 dsdX 1 [Pseudomonadota bacterium]